MKRLRLLINAVAFTDGDLSGDLQDLNRKQVIWPMPLGYDIGFPRTGLVEKGSLTPVQRFGNWLTTRLIALFRRVHFTEAAPLCVLRRGLIERLKLRGRTIGWSAEMQTEAA
ncbi:MAG: hypothetical protein M1404_01610 [Acidobacteria bacterium]|nr:hypothetical protein [Acidobacteriota bacterium]